MSNNGVGLSCRKIPSKNTVEQTCRKALSKYDVGLIVQKTMMIVTLSQFNKMIYDCVNP